MENDEMIHRREALALAIESARMQRPIGSPCIDVCRLNAVSGYCDGCLRTREEIKAWKAMGDSERSALLDRLAARSERSAE